MLSFVANKMSKKSNDVSRIQVRNDLWNAPGPSKEKNKPMASGHLPAIFVSDTTSGPTISIDDQRKKVDNAQPIEDCDKSDDLTRLTSERSTNHLGASKKTFVGTSTRKMNE